MIQVTITGPAKSGKTFLSLFLERQLSGLTKSVQVSDEIRKIDPDFQDVLDILSEMDVQLTVQDEISAPDSVPEAKSSSLITLEETEALSRELPSYVSDYWERLK